MQLLRENGFTFGDKHSFNNFGLMYQEKDGHEAIPAITRNEYKVAGQSGTVLFDGIEQGTLTFSGTLWPHEEPGSQMQAQALIRRVQEWLVAGRQKLIFDYEPQFYYLAQLSARSQWSLENWFGGELSVTFEAQPYAYAVHESVFSASGSGTVQVNASMPTLWDAPAVIRITNTGSSALTGVNINDGQIVFSGLSLAQGSVLVISSEVPIGAVTGAGDNALPGCTAFRPLCLKQGANTVQVAVTGAESVSVEVRARGRW